MSRPKEFPEKIYKMMTPAGELVDVDLPEKGIEYMRQAGIRVQLYCVPEPFRKPHKAAPVPTPVVVAPPEPDKPPTEAVGANLPIVETESTTKQWICSVCGLRFDIPLLIKHINTCPNPNCNSQHLIRLPIIRLPKKRHRRTKAEILMIEKDKGMEEIIEDKPHWRCSNSLCNWSGDNPSKGAAGYHCLECGQKAVKNEAAE